MSTDPKRTGNAHPNIAPYEVYQTAPQPLFLTVGNKSQFGKLCVELCCPELTKNPRFIDNGARLANRDALREAVEEAMKHMDGQALAERLIHIGVPCGPVLETSQVLAHPHTAHREIIVEIGAYKGTCSPIKLSRTPCHYERPPPALRSTRRIFSRSLAPRQNVLLN